VLGFQTSRSATDTAPPASETDAITELTAAPTRWGPWIREIWVNREVIGVLTRKDFQVRYKRASFGLLWAVLLPLIQAVVFVVIFSRIGRFSHTPFSYPAYVLAGTLAWSYFNITSLAASTSIVDNAILTDKVWFPRSILVLVPALSNLFGLLTSMILLIAALPVIHAHLTWHLILLVPAVVLLSLFTAAFGLVTSSLHVYFRDVKFIVQAGLTIFFYLTPIVYPASALHTIGPWMALNPMSGIVGLFQFAAAGHFGPLGPSLVVSCLFTAGLLIAGLEGNRRHDRLFVDKL
jgi:lipopolysaccharide transport system permease protein